MREFDVGAPQASPWKHFLLGGKPKAGKTTFAATAPRPLFLADEAEGGYKVLDRIDTRLFWEPNFKPRVWTFSNMMEYPQALTRLETMARDSGGKLPWQTLVFDSLSIYAQRILREVKLSGSKDGKMVDNRARYGDMGDAIALAIARIHALPMHVIWLIHTDDNDELVVGGKAATAAYAYMDQAMLIRKEVDAATNATNFQLHTQPFRRATWIGGRLGDFPSPMIPSFKCIAELLKLPGKPASPSLPPYGGEEFWDGASYLNQ